MHICIVTWVLANGYVIGLESIDGGHVDSHYPWDVCLHRLIRGLDLLALKINLMNAICVSIQNHDGMMVYQIWVLDWVCICSCLYFWTAGSGMFCPKSLSVKGLDGKP
ncbi:hypothetical protein R6Q59_016605 [Mikania micrantha]